MRIKTSKTQLDLYLNNLVYNCELNILKSISNVVLTNTIYIPYHIETVPGTEYKVCNASNNSQDIRACTSS